MKVLLTTLNSKYVQSNLAIRYLRAYCAELPIKIVLKEYNINQQLDYVLAEIYKIGADLIGFSCYLWNITPILQLCDSLRKVAPEIKIVLGGPEVSFDPESILQENQYIDYIVRGEGEETFYELLTILLEESSPEQIPGIVYIRDDVVVSGPERSLIANLDQIPSPFLDYLEEFQNKLVYYESSRGCPFNCQYCLSSTFQGVRTFSMDRIKNDLLQLIEAEVPRVKFVDRTFNFKSEHALEIMEFLLRNQRKTNFHFEITAHLISDEILRFLKDVPTGLFQFEIGVQSTHKDTLQKIRRVDDFHRLTEVVRVLSEYKNIHLHLDLIAGLPAENYIRFQQSFNDIFKLKPDNLQLGFLKLLKGSGIRDNADEYGYRYLTEPPYEILANDLLSFAEILELKLVEDLLETFYNSHRFEMSVDFIITRWYWENPYKFFEELKAAWQEGGYNHAPVKDIVLYRFLLEFCLERFAEDQLAIKEYVKYDFLRNNRTSNLPEWLISIDVANYKSRCYQFVNDESKVAKYLPHLQALESRQIMRRILIQPFAFDIFEYQKQGYTGEPKCETFYILFDYERRDSIFGQVESMVVVI